MESAVYKTAGSALVPFSQDYSGVVKLLRTSGFSPFKNSNSPSDSALKDVFDTFIKSTGSNYSSSELSREFFDSNPYVKNSMNIYNTIQRSFSPAKHGERSSIENFLKEKIDEFIKDKDTDGSGLIELGEGGYGKEKFYNIDSDYNDVIDAEEIEDNFYEDFKELRNLLGYFRPPSGTFIDLTA